jgi:site-specific DNA-methyltransferase (adenine-specific)
MELINDDCLTALTNIADKSVNLVIADLPYGQTDNAWDIKIDLNQLWQHLKRVGTNNCAYIFFTTTKFGFDLISSNKDWFRYDLVWHKSHSCAGFLLAKKMPMRSHEMIYVFYNKLPTYNIVGNHIKLDVKQTKTYLGGETYGTNKKIRQTGASWEPRLPKSVLEFNNSNNSKKRYHATQKPIDLLEWLIRYYTNEGDTILDPTMGSGSTGVACKNLNRNFIGIEMDKGIFDVACDRILCHLHLPSSKINSQPVASNM